MSKSKISPTARTLKTLRANGLMCDVCEKWIPWVGKHGVRKDLFSFIDLIALDPSRGIVGVQCCARSGHAAHRRKILDDCTELAMEWLQCGGKIEIWSWAKQKVVRGGKAERWTPKVEEITLQAWEG